MQEKIILDLCGGTGAWSRPYREAGYTVHVITLPEYDVTDVQFNDGSLYFHRQSKDTVADTGGLYIDCSQVYGILAAPPCTEFSLAKGAAPRDFAGAMTVVEACLKIVWHCRIHGKPKFWVLENPVGFLRQFLGRPAFTFEQWQFGDMQIKPTDIWGYFRDPIPTIKERPAGLSVQIPNGRRNGRGWAKPDCPKEYHHLGLNRQEIRAITPAGFANAFFRANR